MSNLCGFCDINTETVMLVLGDQWFEFCAPCGDTETLTHAETGEVATIKSIFNNVADGTPVATQPALPAPVVQDVFLNGLSLDVATADRLWDIELETLLQA